MIVRDRDFAVCIAHEEEGQGPSLERLILDRSFKEAASLLEPGASIPFAILPCDAAVWLDAWLDKRGLRIDRDGDEWFVTKRGERGSDLVARLGVALHVVLPPLLFAIFALLAGACSPSLPSMDHPLDASKALDVVLAGTNVAHPTVYGVPADCDNHNPASMTWGFLVDGRCVGGLTEPDVGIFIVVVPPPSANHYSMTLPHEAVGHWAAGGDMDPHHTGAAFLPGGAVDVARTALQRSGVDEMRIK